MQLNLFDLARRSDPPTSHIAAAEVAPRLSGLRADFVRRLRAIGIATANEIADGDESVRKRAKELERQGIIAAVGTRRCRVTGKMATVYEVVQ